MPQISLKNLCFGFVMMTLCHVTGLTLAHAEQQTAVHGTQNATPPQFDSQDKTEPVATTQDRARVAPETVPSNSVAPMVKEFPDITLGSPQARTTLIEYSCISCVSCALFHRNYFQMIKEKFIDTGQVYYIYRHFPLDGQAVLSMAMIALMPQDQWFDKISLAYSKIDQWINQDPQKLIDACGITNANDADPQRKKVLIDSIIAKRYNAEKEYDIPHTPFFVIIRDGKKDIINEGLTMNILLKKLTV